MMRRGVLALMLLLPVVPQAQPAPTPAERQRQLDHWWARQREKEAADRFWNGPSERRRALTRDQIEQWEQQRDRRLRRGPAPLY